MQFVAPFIALTFTKLHLNSGGDAGKIFEKSLESSLARINHRAMSPVSVKTEERLEKMEISTGRIVKITPSSNTKVEQTEEKMEISPDTGKRGLVEEFQSIFESKHQNSGAVRQFIGRLDKITDFGPLLESMAETAKSPNTQAFAHHATMFSNVYKRLIQKLKQTNELGKLKSLNEALKNICNDDDKVKSSPGLKTLRILVKDVDKKLSHTVKLEPAKEKKILSFLEFKSAGEKVKTICEALHNEKDHRICGFLADLFIENNYDMLNVLPEEELRLFFSSASNLPQLQSLFLQNARWETINKCIDLLLSQNTEGVRADAVLNFLWAVERIRLLWKGKEMGAQRYIKIAQIRLLVQGPYA